MKTDHAFKPQVTGVMKMNHGFSKSGEEIISNKVEIIRNSV